MCGWVADFAYIAGVQRFPTAQLIPKIISIQSNRAIWIEWAWQTHRILNRETMNIQRASKSHKWNNFHTRPVLSRLSIRCMLNILSRSPPLSLYPFASLFIFYILLLVLVFIVWHVVAIFSQLYSCSTTAAYIQHATERRLCSFYFF